MRCGALMSIPDGMKFNIHHCPSCSDHPEAEKFGPGEIDGALKAIGKYWGIDSFTREEVRAAWDEAVEDLRLEQ